VIYITKLRSISEREVELTPDLFNVGLEEADDIEHYKPERKVAATKHCDLSFDVIMGEARGTTLRAITPDQLFRTVLGGSSMLKASDERSLKLTIPLSGVRSCIPLIPWTEPIVATIIPLS
jgi:hypothetical protein